ncbi:hypothetical protein O7626_00315 [Micromonospora sp. WMMD1102]|uniref:hypothetical protein n=1 Tax=Micromonospora sp. WMMD1102 TaxID=3016105 RepID=UPI0024151D0D|nr:hypothetical protein [Micromonospora sp. WMMD1102]MDG4784389.1 hypothetical protein [Micromonospora sp. WMMD1102]
MTAPQTCARPECTRTDELVGGYCSDTCLRADMAPDDLPPVTVLGPNKSGGFGRDIHWMIPQPVHVPPWVGEGR